MAHVCLFHRSPRQLGFNAVALFGKFQNVQRAVRFHFGNVAGFEVILDCLPENGRKTRGITPSQVAPFKRVRRLGVSGGEFAEVFPLLGAIQKVFGRAAGFAFRGVVCVGEQDVFYAVFRGVASGEARLFRKIRVDFTFRNVDFRIHFAFPQALLRDFFANLTAELAPGDAFFPETIPQFIRGHAVVAGDLLDGGRHHLLVNADADFTGPLLHGLFRDEAIQHLSAQLRHRGKLDILAAQVDRHLMHAVLKFEFRDDVVVDDGNDAV